MMYPQDYEDEPTEWYLKRPSSRKVASRIAQWESGNVLAAALILIDPGASGLALEWARMVQKRKPYDVDTAIKTERANPQPKPARNYSDRLPKVREKPPQNPETAMDSFFARTPPGARGL